MAMRGARAWGLHVVPAAREPIFTGRVLISAALCLGFSLGLVGRGPPFWAAAAAFLFAHILVFEVLERRTYRRLPHTIVLVLAISAGASLAISTLFQEFFLVRLP
jgi:uncharacterized membrane protein YhhN